MAELYVSYSVSYFLRLKMLKMNGENDVGICWRPRWAFPPTGRFCPQHSGAV